MDRQQQLKLLFDAHSAAEAEQDVAKALATCTEDIVYEHPLFPESHPDREIRGPAAVGDYYRRSWGAHPLQSVEITRSWLCGNDVLVTEVLGMIGRPGEPVQLVRSIAIGEFRGTLLAREIVYVSAEGR